LGCMKNLMNSFVESEKGQLVCANESREDVPQQGDNLPEYPLTTMILQLLCSDRSASNYLTILTAFQRAGISVSVFKQSIHPLSKEAEKGLGKSWNDGTFWLAPCVHRLISPHSKAVGTQCMPLDSILGGSNNARTNRTLCT
jgi:hypothetical protein